MKKIILPISILLASVILGGFYYATQANKQESIERQQEMKIEAEKEQKEEELEIKEKEIGLKKEKMDKEETKKRENELKKEECIKKAKDHASSTWTLRCRNNKILSNNKELLKDIEKAENNPDDTYYKELLAKIKKEEITKYDKCALPKSLNEDIIEDNRKDIEQCNELYGKN